MCSRDILRRFWLNKPLGGSVFHCLQLVVRERWGQCLPPGSNRQEQRQCQSRSRARQGACVMRVHGANKHSKGYAKARKQINQCKDTKRNETEASASEPTQSGLPSFSCSSSSSSSGGGGCRKSPPKLFRFSIYTDRPSPPPIGHHPQRVRYAHYTKCWHPLD